MAIGEEHPVGQSDRRRRSPETLRLRAVMPMLLVSDLERSLAWYRDILGFIVAEELRRDGAVVAAQLKAGKVQFLLEKDPDPNAPTPRGYGIRLYCATRQNVMQIAGLIQERGGTIEEAPDDAHGGRDFSVVDPDGYTISVYWRPES
jgi:catechol 2,3-dioxygenase-like lactoylglutathione lyase family enzyme